MASLKLSEVKYFHALLTTQHIFKIKFNMFNKAYLKLVLLSLYLKLLSISNDCME